MEGPGQSSERQKGEKGPQRLRGITGDTAVYLGPVATGHTAQSGGSVFNPVRKWRPEVREADRSEDECH